jgi:hypothetical protein
LPEKPEAAFDHLGRKMSPTKTVNVSQAPQFFVFSSLAVKKPTLHSAPTLATRLEGTPSPVVLQAVMPVEKLFLNQSCYKVFPNETLPLNIYNFGGTPVAGTLAVEAPKDWKMTLPEKLEIAPGEKKTLGLTLEAGSQNAAAVETVRIRGDFGAAGKPVLSLRLKREGT